MLAMIRKLFQRPRVVETELESSESFWLKPRELGVKILREIESSNELNRVLNWLLSGGYRMECCFLIDGTVKFMLYHRGRFLKEVIWAKVDESGKRNDAISPMVVVWDWIEKYY